MNVIVKKVTFDESILEVQTKSGIKTLVVNKTQYGHSYDDFSEWDITDKQYYELEDLIDIVIDEMRWKNKLNVSWECE